MQTSAQNISFPLYRPRSVGYNTNVCGGKGLNTHKKKQEIENNIPALILLVMMLVLFLTGCGLTGVGRTGDGRTDDGKTDGVGTSAEKDDETGREEETISLGEGFVGEEKYEQSFKKPKTNVNILIDLQGYAPEDKKHAYFIGENLSDTFYVYESTENRLVYSGVIGKAQSDGGKTISCGDFSAVTEPGVYYIQTAVIGRSYSFRIAKDRYTGQLTEMEEQFAELTPADYYGEAETIQQRCEMYHSFQILALAGQIYAERMSDSFVKKLQEHASWFLESRQQVLAQRKEEGMEKAPSEEEKARQGHEDYQFACAIASCYPVICAEDTTLASKCLREAQKAYQNAQKLLPDGGADRYNAAAALYRVTGSYVYHGEVKKENTLSVQERFWGDLYYMMSLRSVDTNLCSEKMSDFMKLCGQYSDKSGKSAYGLAAKEEEIPDCAVQLAVADYIIVSREYRNVYKEQLHYLLYEKEPDELSHICKSAQLFVLAGLSSEQETE